MMRGVYWKVEEKEDFKWASWRMIKYADWENIWELSDVAKGPLEVYGHISVFCLHSLAKLILFVPR